MRRHNSFALRLMINYLPRLLLLVSVLIVSNCDGPEPAPDGGDDGGIGTNETVISNVEITNAPSGYNSTYEDSFIVQMKGTVTPQDYNRNNRLWFDITKFAASDPFSRSNWLEVSSNDQTENGIEWGGAWTYGVQSSDTYDLSPNIITYKNDVVENVAAGNKVIITINKFDGSVTSKSVEYDEQQGQNVYGTAALGDITDGQRAVDQAFFPAGKMLEFSVDQTNITPAELLNFNNQADLLSFINSNRNQDKDMYVAGIQGFYTGSDPDSINNTKLGATPVQEGFPKSSLIAHEAIANNVNAYLNSPYDHPEKRFITHKNMHQRVVIHELGHFLGNFGHPKDHTSIYCIMFQSIGNQGLIDELDGVGPVRSTYVNPHFCGDCLEKIRDNS